MFDRVLNTPLILICKVMVPFLLIPRLLSVEPVCISFVYSRNNPVLFKKVVLKNLGKFTGKGPAM